MVSEGMRLGAMRSVQMHPKSPNAARWIVAAVGEESLCTTLGVPIFVVVIVIVFPVGFVAFTELETVCVIKEAGTSGERRFTHIDDVALLERHLVHDSGLRIHLRLLWR